MNFGRYLILPAAVAALPVSIYIRILFTGNFNSIGDDLFGLAFSGFVMNLLGLALVGLPAIHFLARLDCRPWQFAGLAVRAGAVTGVVFATLNPFFPMLRMLLSADDAKYLLLIGAIPGAIVSIIWLAINRDIISRQNLA